MMLFGVCLRELYAHYDVPFLGAAQGSPHELLRDKQSQVQQSAKRFKNSRHGLSSCSPVQRYKNPACIYFMLSCDSISGGVRNLRDLDERN